MLYDILLDVGGTGIKGGYYNTGKNILSDSYNFISNSDKEKDVIIKHFITICGRIWEQIHDDNKRIRSIRMAFPGPFDYGKGISKIKGLAKYESLYSVSIPDEMIHLGIKENYDFIPRSNNDFQFVNDVEAYALGAMNKRNLYQGYRVIYVCIGTGCGSAFSIDGQISTDRSQGILENGWIYSLPFKDMVIDEYISARGINKLALRYCNQALSPLELSKIAENGNKEAIQAYKEFGDDLAAALLPLLKQFKANTLVIGGNISRSSDLFISPLKESCKALGVDLIIESDTSRLTMLGLTTL